ncbi:MAG: hypothetical protein JWP57_1681, partial [Spirosoma sp.]|nr:hypothetical protein [Spirosoma sp.]
TVFEEQGRASSIGARPIFFRSGNKGAPTHDELTPSSTGRFEGDLWLMDAGSSSIELDINGPDGRQHVVVPVMSVATAVRTMPEGTGVGLALMGLLLVIMMITIIGASNADGITKPGQMVLPALGRRRLVGMGIGAVVLALLLTGWRSWWNSSAEQYQNEQLYKPLRMNASVGSASGLTGKKAGPELTIRIDTTGFGDGTRKNTSQQRRLMSFVIPDHGKLMHTFLVRLPGLDAFAHLHPNRRDTLTYNAALPPLPAGRYLLYSDIVFRSGFAETMTDTVVISGQSDSAHYGSSDGDDSWLATVPMGIKAGAENVPHLDNDMVVCGKPGASMKLADGSSMLWMDKPQGRLESGKLYNLKFAVADSLGKAAALEPYLGMGGHAVILRSDGTVYIHLHPVGTYSMAAESLFAGRLADTARTFKYPDANRFRDSIDRYVAHIKTSTEAEKTRLLTTGMPGMNHTMTVNNMVQFPYAFPRAGHYRIWVQVKRNGRVQTGVFDTQVNDPLL